VLYDADRQVSCLPPLMEIKASAPRQSAAAAAAAASVNLDHSPPTWTGARDGDRAAPAQTEVVRVTRATRHAPPSRCRPWRAAAMATVNLPSSGRSTPPSSGKAHRTWSNTMLHVCSCCDKRSGADETSALSRPMLFC